MGAPPIVLAVTAAERRALAALAADLHVSIENAIRIAIWQYGRWQGCDFAPGLFQIRGVGSSRTPPCRGHGASRRRDRARASAHRRGSVEPV